MESIRPKVILVILDGYGLSSDVESNAVIKSATPVLDTLARKVKFISLQAAGEAVGLPWGEMGNSEVGHINIGSGRVVLSDYTQIDKAIKSRSFYSNSNFSASLQNVKLNKSQFHILGLASDGGVHGSTEHIIAIARLAVEAGVEPYLHLITDGRDTAPKVARAFIINVENQLLKLGKGRIVTISGRYFAMDRDKRFERTKMAYENMVNSSGNNFNTAIDAIENAYKNNQTDEFIEPVTIGQKIIVSNNDSLIFTNFRSDRAIQLTKCFLGNVSNIKTTCLSNLFIATMTEYEHGLGLKPLFSVVDLNDIDTNPLTNPLAKIISDNSLRQIHAAESEKFAHVTYFFNAGVKEPFPGEKRIIVSSPKVSTYDLAPEMSAANLTDNFIKEWKVIKPEFSVINFANADMVGHSGNQQATIIGIETVDNQIKKIIDNTKEERVIICITGDHGNAEQLKNVESGEIDKEHTTNNVPLIMFSNEIVTNNTKWEISSIEDKIKLAQVEPIGLLADIAPSIIYILGLEKPPEMTGQNLWT